MSMRYGTLLATVLATLFIHYESCYGVEVNRVPTMVKYDMATQPTSISGASAELTGNSYYQRLYIDEDSNPNLLLVGTNNSVEIYNTTDVSTALESVFLPLKELSEPGALQCQSTQKNPAFLCQNYINVIQKYNNTWYYCGTSGVNPQCWICAKYQCSDAEKGNSFNALGLVEIRPKHESSLLISGTSVFTAAPTVDNGEKFMLARSAFDSSTGQFSEEVETSSIFSHWINAQLAQCIADPIEYTNSDGESHIYYFYREYADEYKHIDQTNYSRIARVCKNDDGGDDGSSLQKRFTTFLKARLNCSIQGEFPFNYDILQDVYQSTDENILYAAFTDNTVGTPNTAICVYRMDEIDAVFKSSPFKGRKGGTRNNVNNIWVPVKDEDDTIYPDPRPGKCVTHAESDFPFITDYPLMDSSIPSKQVYPGSVMGNYDRDSDPPLMLLDGLHVTEVVVDEDVNGKDIFFLGTADGKVYKAFVNGLGTADVQTRLFEEIDLGGEVLNMKLHSDTLFIGTVSSLHAIPVQHCVDYTTYADCIRAHDPYCVWSGTVIGGSCVSGDSGDQCLKEEPFSCEPSKWPAPVIFEPEYVREPQYVRAINAGVDTVPVNVIVTVEQNSVWGETTYSCNPSCGCPPIDVQETTALSTTDSMEYLLGVYEFDMSSCSTNVDITLTFKANGNTVDKMVTVKVDSKELVTDQTVLEKMSKLDEQICAYWYQRRWWETNKATTQNAEEAYCYNC